jgi:hypothetical protein
MDSGMALELPSRDESALVPLPKETFMRIIAACLLVLTVASIVPGCGGASGIESGIPANTAPPPDFDPGGTAKPDMSGKATKPAVP